MKSQPMVLATRVREQGRPIKSYAVKPEQDDLLPLRTDENSGRFCPKGEIGSLFDGEGGTTINADKLVHSSNNVAGLKRTGYGWGDMVKMTGSQTYKLTCKGEP